MEPAAGALRRRGRGLKVGGSEQAAAGAAGQPPDADVHADLGLSSGAGRTAGAEPPPGSPPRVRPALSAGGGATGAVDALDGRAASLAVGTLLAERYQVVELLGRGGMGAVYRVFDRVRETEVALKVMLPSLLARPRAVERFKHEAELMLRLSHPCIVRVFDVGFDAALGLRFFTMELLRGRSLRQWLEERRRAGRLPEPAEALEIARQLLEALRYAHRTTIHRDLKPENVFLLEGPELQVKVLDFGIAKLAGARGMTADGAALGTPYYMAPEQREDAARVDQRADLFAVSVMLYEMLTGQLPVGRFRTPTEERRALPPAIDELVLRGLEPQPERRFETAERVLEELERIRRLLERGGAGAARSRVAARARWGAPAGAVTAVGGWRWRSGSCCSGSSAGSERLCRRVRARPRSRRTSAEAERTNVPRAGWPRPACRLRRRRGPQGRRSSPQAAARRRARLRALRRGAARRPRARPYRRARRRPPARLPGPGRAKQRPWRRAQSPPRGANRCRRLRTRRPVRPAARRPPPPASHPLAVRHRRAAGPSRRRWSFRARGLAPAAPAPPPGLAPAGRASRCRRGCAGLRPRGSTSGRRARGWNWRWCTSRPARSSWGATCRRTSARATSTRLRTATTSRGTR
ncbi:MAG: hypothetical protein KatS3mg102_2496 [Planctomycetota bacterium]|nr:MAG: hypothetical protein KatS3mg102_2496 [Planctomycetota bacterium]